MPRSEAPAFPFEALEKEKPLIYISLGTASNNRPEFFRACIEALGGGDWQFVMAVGTQVERSELGTIQGNVIVREIVPLIGILPAASIFLTPGGIITVI